MALTQKYLDEILGKRTELERAVERNQPTITNTPRGIVSGTYADILKPFVSNPVGNIVFGDIQQALDSASYGKPLTTGGSVQTGGFRPEYLAAALGLTPAGKGKKVAEVAKRTVSSPKNMKINQTVSDPQRIAFSGIYKDPREIAAEAASRVAPEDPAMKMLFGVNRDELYEQSRGRIGNREPEVKMAANPKGSSAADKVMNPANTQRIVDALAEAERYPQLQKGMDSWYNLDPVFNRMVELFGKEEAIPRYNRFNTLSGMASPGSEVLTEINRGTAANYLAESGRFDDFVKYGGVPYGQRGANFPKDLMDVKGHMYHKTAQAIPMQKYIESGMLQMDSPKVPLYIQSSGTPETGFQTALPVGDAHWSRGIGLADTRTSKGFGASVSTPELQSLGDWWKNDIAGALGIESVPAQARAWGVFAPQTGVGTPVGAPKLELLSQRIMAAAKRYGISPEKARDMILSGKGYAGLAATGVGTGLLMDMPKDDGYM